MPSIETWEIWTLLLIVSGIWASLKWNILTCTSVAISFIFLVVTYSIKETGSLGAFGGMFFTYLKYAIVMTFLAVVFLIALRKGLRRGAVPASSRTHLIIIFVVYLIGTMVAVIVTVASGITEMLLM